VASMVRTKETMRLEFYQFLLLKKQIQMNEHQGTMYRKEGTGWKLKGLWRRLFGRKKRAEDKEPGSVSKGQVKSPKLQSVFWRGSTWV